MEKLARLEKDQYFTSSPLVDELMNYVDLIGDPDRPYTVLEPCCGEGHISDSLMDAGCTVVSSDVDSALTYPDFFWDAKNDYWQIPVLPNYRLDWSRPDWVVTNPPYTQPDCQQIIENAFEHCNVGIAMLLRLTYLEPCKGRAKFLKDTWLSHLIIFNPRPRFRLDTKGTDNCTVAWFVWQKRKGHGTKITNVTNWNNGKTT